MRQLSIIESCLNEYKKGKIALNSLVETLEAVTGILEDDEWEEKVFPIIVCLEQMNAASIVFNPSLSDDDLCAIEKCIKELKSIIDWFKCRNL